MDTQRRSEVGQKVVPITLTSRGEQGWGATAMVQYGKALFASTFSISPRGQVTMEEDKPLMAELPVKSVTLVEGVRYETY